MRRTRFVAAMLFSGAAILAVAKADSIALQEPAGQVKQAEKGSTQDKQAAERTPPYYESVEDVKEIPKTLSPEKFDDPTTRQAYQVARDNPKLLLQLPCYCPCDRAEVGHKSLLDCFVDTHAAGCGICISEALKAAKLQKEGVSVQEIRAKLAAEYLKGQ